MRYAGADHLDGMGCPASLLGRTVAEALGYVYRGLYHLPTGSLKRATWRDERCVSINVPGFDMASWDGARLTQLVVVSHDLGLRLEISPAGPRHLKLRFSQRTTREGSISCRLPTLEDHVLAIRHGYTVEAPNADNGNGGVP
jgi:hypothetical protein